MNTYLRSSVVFKLVSLTVALSLTFVFFAQSATASVSPELVIDSISTGGSLDVDKEVTTPSIPQDPEICVLADTTGSMGPALANAQANATAIMNTIKAAQPNAEFCAAQYRDVNDVPFFNLDQDLTTNVGDVQAAIDSWSAGGGGDTPEGQLNALHELATGAANYDGPNRIIVWFGDASGHDPSNGNTLASVISDLEDSSITVIAIPVNSGFGDGLDATGQATAIINATNGVLLSDATPDEVANAVLTGLLELTTDVWYEVACEDGLSVTLSPSVHHDVPGGSTVDFDEVITVDDDVSLQGQSRHCTVNFLANSYPDGGASVGVENIWIRIPDTSDPIAQCTSTVNPHGNNKPPAGSSDLPGAKGGQNEDGFYELSAEDNIGVAGIYVNGFGPYVSGDKIKVTEAPGADPKENKMGSTQAGNNGKSDAIASHLILDEDPTVTAVDGAGNEHLVSCLVPPLPK